MFREQLGLPHYSLIFRNDEHHKDTCQSMLLK